MTSTQSVAASGTADLNTGRPVPSDGCFRMADTSRTLLVTVILQLEAEGRLSLDDSVDHWLPGVVRGNGNDGGRSAVVSMSEARGDTPEHILAQENAAGALIDHALCAGGPARPVSAGDAK
ncbi:serine hydrolase domain-containing protein [Streptomyces sp900129855]|uniref:Serine hydrolase domain-containing protein n=1 Tax=Streptomyces sp. 900129855 TaxID=3155129 RepID=A0ABV2ZST1_9ACTN